MQVQHAGRPFLLCLAGLSHRSHPFSAQFVRNAGNVPRTCMGVVSKIGVPQKLASVASVWFPFKPPPKRVPLKRIGHTCISPSNQRPKGYPQKKRHPFGATPKCSWENPGTPQPNGSSEKSNESAKVARGGGRLGWPSRGARGQGRC